MAEPQTLATIATPSASPPAGNSPSPAPATPGPRVAAPPVKPASPDPKTWAEMSPDARAAHQRTISDAGRTSASLHTRTPDGRPLIDGKLADGTIYQPDGEPAPADSAAPATTGEKFKVGQYEVTEAEIGELMAEKAARDLRAATAPPTAADYKFEISPEAKLPGNIAVKFDQNDPALRDAAAWAHSKGLDQAGFSEMLTIYASHVASQEAAMAERARAEIDKAGKNAGSRVDAVSKWIRSEVGDVDARPILATIVTDSHLRFYEKLHQKITSQGAASFSTAHRDPEPKGLSDEQWNSMSYSQKKAYSEAATARQNRGR